MRFPAAPLLAAALVCVLAPVAINTNLRWTYEQTLAHWLSKVRAPDRVFIGDSITAGGGDFGHFGTINLGITGATTRQVAAYLRKAQAYNPREIVVMAGANDIDAGTPDAMITAAWRTIMADKRVVVVLVPHMANAAANVRVDHLNAMITAMARENGRRVVTIAGLDDASGQRRRDATTDGVHFSQRAYTLWRAALDHQKG